MIWNRTRRVRQALTGAALILCGTMAQAQSLSELVENDIGYVTLRPGVILVETRTGGSFCKIDVSDQVFSSFADGSLPNDSAFTCIPYDVFNSGFVHSGKRGFTDLIDDSEGYTYVRDGVILVDDGAATSLCQITISDADFTRFAEQGTSGVQDTRAICVFLDELEI